MAVTDRATAIATIKADLKRRSGKAWSVTGGKGTAYGWIKIDAPPKRRIYSWDGTTIVSPTPGSGQMSLADRTELGKLLGLDFVHPQGVSIAASGAYRTEYMERAAGQVPTEIAQPYWD